MAEWTIAAVLKTAGLTAPGVRIPLPPPEGSEPFHSVIDQGDTIATILYLTFEPGKY